MTFRGARHTARSFGTLLVLAGWSVAARAQYNQYQQQQQYPQQQYQQYPQQQYPQQQYPQQQYPQQQYPQQQYPQQQYPQQEYPQQQYPQQQYPQQQYPQQQYPQQQYPQQQYPQQYDPYAQSPYAQQPGEQPPEAGQTPPETDAGAQSAPDANGSKKLVSALLELDLGMTARMIDLPTSAGLYRLDTGFVPAFGLKVGSRVHGERFFLGVALAYQSSLAAKGTQPQTDPGAAALTTSIRSSHFEGGVLPGIHLGSGPDSASLALFAGYGVRALATVEELRMPRFTLHGPVFRIEFELPLANVVTIRLAPEAHYILSLSRGLRRTGVVSGSGVAFGGEASVRVAIASWAAAQIAFRESHASSKTAFDSSFKDVERYLLLSGVFRYF